MAPHHAPHVRAREQKEADARHEQWLNSADDWGTPEEWPPDEPIERPYISPEKEKAINIQSAITWNHFKPNKDFVFTEGSYDLPLAGIKTVLEPLDLWDVANTEEVALEDSGRDKSAFFIIRAFIHWRILKKWNITLLTPSFEVLKKLEAGCGPFRLMDLPRELRDNIYEYMGEDLIIDEEGDDPIQFFQLTKFRRTREVVHTFAHSIMKEPASLLQLTTVCQEFREHFTEMYFARNAFELPGDCWIDALAELAKIAQELGMWRVKQMRCLRVNIQWYKGMTAPVFV